MSPLHKGEESYQALNDQHNLTFIAQFIVFNDGFLTSINNFIFNLYHLSDNVFDSQLHIRISFL